MGPHTYPLYDELSWGQFDRSFPIPRLVRFSEGLLRGRTRSSHFEEFQDLWQRDPNIGQTLRHSAHAGAEKEADWKLTPRSPQAWLLPCSRVPADGIHDRGQQRAGLSLHTVHVYVHKAPRSQ